MILSSFRSAFLALLLPALALATGCHAPSADPVATVVAAPHRVENANRIPTSPEYKQAQEAYKRHDYSAALALLGRLASRPDLSTEERDFLTRQQTLCKNAQHPEKKTAVVAASAASPALPKTAADADCGPRALAIACRKLGVAASVEQLRQAAGTTAQGSSMAGLAKAAKSVGVEAEGVQVSREALNEVETPAVAWVNQNHYVALLALSGEGERATATIHDPNDAAEKTITREQFLRLCNGYLLLLKR